QLEALVAPLVARTLHICDEALRAAGVTMNELSDVLLVGGQTRMPLVRNEVAAHFHREPRCNLNPDEVVALGAGLLPSLLARGRIHFRDVLPMAIGVVGESGYQTLFERNAPVPMRKSI